MTAQPKIPTFTREEIAATRRSLNLHALWKALEAAPLPRLAAWVEAAYLANAFHDQDFVVDAVRRRLAIARIAPPTEAARWAEHHVGHYMDLLPEELSLARARLGGIGPLLGVRKALAAVAPYTGNPPALARIRRPPSNAALILAVEDLELALAAAGLELAAGSATALRLHMLGVRQLTRAWLDAVGEGAAPWLWVWTDDPTGLVDQARADVAARPDLPPEHVAAIQSAITTLLTAAGLPADTTGAARREARRAALQDLAEALHAEGRRHRYGELVLFLAHLDGRLDEVARCVRLPRNVRSPDGLAWVRISNLWRLRRQLSPVATLPRIAEALAAFEALP
ncbi:MAG: hypothetical protein IPI35_24820 [Deltaproteobacteria bacterium]|nr:hypothetical protein [Deltaproteobacteria bacterium]